MTNPSFHNLTFVARYDDTPGTAAASPSLADLMGGALGTPAPVVGQAQEKATNAGTTGGAPQHTRETVEVDPADVASGVGITTPAEPAAPTETQQAFTAALSEFASQGEQTEGFKLDPAPFVAAMRDHDFFSSDDATALGELFGDNAGDVQTLLNSVLRKSLGDLLTVNLAITEKHSSHILGEQARVTAQATLKGRITDALGDNATPEIVASALATAQAIRGVNKDIPLEVLAENAVNMLLSAKQPKQQQQQPSTGASMDDIMSAFGV